MPMRVFFVSWTILHNFFFLKKDSARLDSLLSPWSVEQLGWISVDRSGWRLKQRSRGKCQPGGRCMALQWQWPDFLWGAWLDPPKAAVKPVTPGHYRRRSDGEFTWRKWRGGICSHGHNLMLVCVLVLLFTLRVCLDHFTFCIFVFLKENL